MYNENLHNEALWNGEEGGATSLSGRTSLRSAARGNLNMYGKVASRDGLIPSVSPVRNAVAGIAAAAVLTPGITSTRWRGAFAASGSIIQASLTGLIRRTVAVFTPMSLRSEAAANATATGRIGSPSKLTTTGQLFARALPPPASGNIRVRKGLRPTSK